MTEHHIAVIAVGQDRPGLLAEITGALMPLAVYHGDPRTTLLPGGNMALMVVVRTDETAQAVHDAVHGIAGPELAVHVHELTDHTAEAVDGNRGPRYVLRIRTAGRPGVLAEFTKVVARHGGNILDFGTRIGGGRVSVLRVDLPPSDPRNILALEAELYKLAEQTGVGIKFYDASVGENEPVARPDTGSDAATLGVSP